MTKKLIFFFLVFFVMVSAAARGGYYYLLERPNMEDTFRVRIPLHTGFDTLVDSLDAVGLDSRRSFELAARITGWGSQIKAGNYVFSEDELSNQAIYSKLIDGREDPVMVHVPSGAHPELIAKRVARNMAFDEEAFLRALRDPVLAEDLGTDTLRLFSYMLPDTYSFYWLNNAEYVIRYIKKRADEVLVELEGAQGEVSKRRLRSLAATDGGGALKEKILNLAAIVQLESSLQGERHTVAGVYMNRIRKGWPLQADPTVHYAIRDSTGVEKGRLLLRDYTFDHPYNTYQFRGLPPSPIANPSASAIRAVLRYEEHDYMFFVAKPDEGHAFNETLAGHNRDVAVWRHYLQGERRKRSEVAEN